MSLRWKLLILLLVTAAAPLLTLGVADHWALLGLGRDLGRMSREQLINEARADLLQTVTGFGRLVETESQLVGAMLWLQADAVRDHLEQHAGLTVERDALLDRLRRIAKGNAASDQILRQYVVLDNGQTLTTGAADVPETYDPRRTEWYRSYQKLEREPIGEGIREIFWYSRVVDPATGQLTLVGTRVLRDRAGEALGVTAIEAPLTGVFSGSRLPVRWADAGSVLLVTCVPPTEIPAEQLAGATTVTAAEQEWVAILLADETSSQAADAATWDADRDTRLLDLPAADAGRFVRHVVAAEAGVLMTQWREQEMVWAYGPLNAGTAVVFALPAQVVEAQVATLQQAVWNRTMGMARSSAVVLGVVLVIVLIVAWRAAREVTVPVQQTAVAAEAIAGGDLDARVTLGRRVPDELNRLGEAFNRMVPKLRDQLEVRQSLQLAMEVQQSLLPAGPPDVPGLQLAGRSVYCDETGGDYYDYLPLSDGGEGRDGVLLAVGDVVGHGIAPALLMATARAALRCHCDGNPDDLARLADQLNRHLCDARFVGRFMTLALVAIDPQTPAATLVCAGHDPPMIYDPAGDRFVEPETRDVPLGIDRDWSYTSRTLAAEDLARGAVLVLGTDGIWEARNAEGEMLGKDRLREAIRAHASDDAEPLADAILAAVAAFRGDAEQADDITLVVAKFPG